jgi:hypothetical protein
MVPGTMDEIVRGLLEKWNVDDIKRVRVRKVPRTVVSGDPVSGSERAQDISQRHPPPEYRAEIRSLQLGQKVAEHPVSADQYLALVVAGAEEAGRRSEKAGD